MNKQGTRLLALLVLVLLGQSLSGLFVQAFLWDQGGDLADLGRYNLASPIALALAFLLLGPMAKRGRSVVAVRIGLLLQVSFFLAVLLLGTRASQYLELLGALTGLGQGAFWVGQNMLIQQATAPDERPRYWSYVSASWSFTALVGPFTGSRLVAGFGPGLGYQVVFGLAALSYGLAALISAGIFTLGSNLPYRLRDGLREHMVGHRWWRTLAAHVVAGFRDGTLSFLPSVLVYVATGDARMMGNFSLITAAVGLVANWLTGRFLPRHKWYQSMLISGLLQAGAASLMLVNLDYTTLLLYSLVGAMAGPLLGIPFLTQTFDAIGADGGESQMERIVIRECCLVLGRSFGMILLLLMSHSFTQQQTAMTALGLVAIAAVAPALILGRTFESATASA